GGGKPSLSEVQDRPDVPSSPPLGAVSSDADRRGGLRLYLPWAASDYDNGLVHLKRLPIIQPAVLTTLSRATDYTLPTVPRFFFAALCLSQKGHGCHSAIVVRRANQRAAHKRSVRPASHRRSVDRPDT